MLTLLVKLIEQVFKPEQLEATFYSPLNALINKDPRMKAALREYAAEMRETRFNGHRCSSPVQPS